MILLAVALAAVDLSALVSMASEPALDLIIALAASQTALVGLWCPARRGSTLVRLAVAGLVVNVWSTALGPHRQQMATVLISELGMVVAAGWCWRMLSIRQGAASAFKSAGLWQNGQVSLAELLALAALLGLLLGPSSELVAGDEGDALKQLGIALAAQALAIGYAIYMPSPGSCATAILMSGLPATVAGTLVESSTRGVRIALISGALLAGALGAVRLCASGTSGSRPLAASGGAES